MNEIDKLQEQISFQENTIEQLNDALTSQQKQLTQLKSEFDIILKLIKQTNNTNDIGNNTVNIDKYEIPPHY